MWKWFSVALGVVTSIGGFLEAGSIATAAQAGAVFGYQLLWPLALGTICLICLIEMAGRLAAVDKTPLPAGVREQFGFTYFVWPLVAETIIDLLVLASEIGGACMGLQLLTGIHFVYFALPVTFFGWLLLWYGNFGIIEYGVSTLGLITLAFVVSAVMLHPRTSDMLRGLLPTLPSHAKSHYWFLAVSIVGATISPYLFNFYSSGAVEDEWGEKDLNPNRVTATLGMGFGGFVSAAVMICAANVFLPRHFEPKHYDQLPALLAPLGRAGLWLFGAALFIACFGAALEISLDIGYVYAQAFGWKWGENETPNRAPAFSAVYTAILLLAALIVCTGIDPMTLTLFSMAATAVVLPLVVFPFLVLMNDKQRLGEHVNGRIGNIVVGLSIVLAFVIAVVAIPLEIFGGS